MSSRLLLVAVSSSIRAAGRFVQLTAGPIALLALVTAPQSTLANGADLPPEVVLQTFVKPEEGHLHLLVRVPLVLLASFALPKRGPGYLDLANIDDRLQQAAVSTGKQIATAANNIPNQFDFRRPQG